MPNTLNGFEQYSSLAVATVTAGGNTAPSPGTQETWTISGSSLPAASNSATPNTGFYIQDQSQPNSEDILVTNISGSSMTVTRGADDTTPVVHQNPFQVRPVITGGSLRAIDPTYGLALGQYVAAATVTSNGTITPPTTAVGTGLSPYVPVTCTGNVTGVIMAAGLQDGQIALISNQSATGAICFAVSGTSRVADGTIDVIWPGASVVLIWNSQTSLWYRANPPSEQYLIQNTSYTLTSTTSAQQLFNASATGAVTVAASTLYWFECEFDLSSLSATSGTFSFGFGGTATFNSIKYVAMAQKSAAAGTPATWPMMIGTSATATALVTASTTTTGAAMIRGYFTTNAAGTLVPQISLSVAAAGVVSTGSWFRLNAIVVAGLSVLGNWS